MDAVRDLLRGLPAAKVATLAEIPRTGHDPQVDGSIRVHYGGATGLLVIG